MNAISRWAMGLLLLLATGAVWGRPVIVPDQTTLTLDEVGMYEVGYALRGQAETRLPVGWTSGLDSPTGAACQSVGVVNGREAWLLHPPWKGRTGVTFQEFTVRLPRVGKITLNGATALRADGVGKSDGVTFRVYVNGQKRVEVNRTESQWLPFACDLTGEAGTTATLRFETDPGPRDNSSFDFALWGGRQLAMPGFAPRVVSYPAPLPLDLRRLVSRQNGSVAPLSGFDGKTWVTATPLGTTFRYAGRDGTLEYNWYALSPAKILSLGQVTLRAQMAGDGPVDVPLGGSLHLDWTTLPVLSHESMTTAYGKSGNAVLTAHYTVEGRPQTLTVTGHLVGKSLVMDIADTSGDINAVDGGGWGPVMRRRTVNVPYCSYPVDYLVHENLFVSAFADWTVSQGSWLDGTKAVYQAKTDGSRNAVRERLVYTAAWHLDETLPNIPNPPSPYRNELANRVMLDIWGGAFDGVQARLHGLEETGIGPAAAILHNWQRFGYDNGLPQHTPANPDLGGASALAALVGEAKKDDVRFALHENYVDYYPTFPGFTATDIALNGDGSRVPAWFNPGTKIQSFAVKPTRMAALEEAQGPEIAARYGPNAAYLDVNSAVPPWFHQDYEAGQAGAGTFRATWDAHRAAWAYERQLHNGPVFGEGNNHWYWSGYLDGTEAQGGQGWPINGGESLGLLVDFDLLKIHPLELNHGMGYYERWWAQGPSAQRGLLSLLDQYRMQEAAFGHEAFRGGGDWADSALTGLEAHLLTPVTARTALANPVGIEYWVGGKWLDSSADVKAGGDWSRVRVRYDNGVTVWANSAASPLTVDGVTLPPYGWRAVGDGLTAGTTLRGGVVSDFAETGDSVYVNARPAGDWLTPGVTRVRPGVAQFAATGAKTFQATYRWTVEQSVPAEETAFVHFVPLSATTGGDAIAFQQDHTTTIPTGQWRAGQTVSDGPYDVSVPSNVAPGDYFWTIGLFSDTNGRLSLQGPGDAQGRIVLGTLHVGADTVSFTPSVDSSGANAPVNVKERVLDFGAVRTGGCVYLRRVGNEWTLRPYPANRSFHVWLSARFGRPGIVRTEDEFRVSLPVKDGAGWRLPLGGASVYHWRYSVRRP